MLHEILLGLVGHSGALIQWRGNSLIVSPSLAFVSSAERSLIEALLPVGARFRFLSEYVESQLFPNMLAQDQHHSQEISLYSRAFAQGLEEVLNRFRETISRAEADIFKREGFTITRLQIMLQEFDMVFPSLCSAVQTIRQRQLHGAQILSVIHQMTLSGVPAVKQSFERLLHLCNFVLYRQISAWMLHGIVADDHHEFFIEQAPTEQLQTVQTPTSDLLTPSGQRNIQNPWTQSKVCDKMIPSYVSMRTVEKVHFSGRAVCVVQKLFKDGSHELLSSDEILSFSSEFLKIQNQPLFDSYEFEEVVDRVRNCIAYKLRELVVVKHDLVSQIRLLRDYYLLGNAIFFQNFLEGTTVMFSLPLTSRTDQELSMTFRSAALKTLDDPEPFLQMFACYVHRPESNPDRTVTLFDVWKEISLAFIPKFPINLIVDEQTMRRYNAVFQLLFVIARVQISLRRAWLPQVKQKSRQQEFQQNWAPFWRLRNRMAHFIDALQFHLQVDVIESEFTILVEKMKGCDDFELIKKYHDEFIQNVVVQSRVENRVMSTINSIFQLCLNFCDILSQPRPLDLIDKAMELAVVGSVFIRRNFLFYFFNYHSYP
eukprot:TRINITY_DN5471_c0_g1_i10.p1 TRINITY_DN5471_c0_g1~~TRINITY_DN5471_c0_g1_i10.p1  ORF type:complete len:598 (-),score=82.11 TRINITY_DN5471_c0_g1_i10:407-2200(-)